MLRSSNPTLRVETLNGIRSTTGDTMTIEGAVNKTLMLLGLTLLASAFTWHLAMTMQPAAGPLIGLGFFGGFIMVLVTSFKMSWAPATAPMYAILEGVALGSLSGFINHAAPGLPAMALFLTFSVLGCMLVAFKTGAIEPTERLRAGLTSALMALCVVSLVTVLLHFLGSHTLSMAIYGNGTIGILFSIGVTALAALFLILDFDFIVKGAEAGAPGYVEWYAAMGLLVTLVWLYLEILRLLMKLQRRD